jgi:hypothetical protein
MKPSTALANVPSPAPRATKTLPVLPVGISTMSGVPSPSASWAATL